MGTQPNHRISGPRRGAAGLLAAAIAGAVTIPSSPPEVVVAADHGSPVRVEASVPPRWQPSERSEPAEPPAPRLVRGGAADALVLVRGGAVCSGTPITGTRYVLTAAHCVLDQEGRPAHRTVVRDGVTHPVVAVWVDTRYADDPSPRFDAAILELDRPVPGPGATLGASLPASGTVTIAGFQPVDTDRTLLRGEAPNDRPSPEPTSGHVIEIESLPAGCSLDVSEIQVTPTRVDVACGLIPGASGGGLFAGVGEAIVLVGIVSTVAWDLSSNGVVPLAAIHELLENPTHHRHAANELQSAGMVEVTRS